MTVRATGIRSTTARTGVRWSTVLFWIVAVALVVAHILIVARSLLVLRFWEDEAFNLTVPLNLLAGLGYSSDGVLSGSEITPFDPRISTGPVVLLPAAAVLAFGGDLVISARLVPVAYWALLIAGLVVIGRRIGGRWAALVAASVPLALDTASGVSPISGPADVLGEIPAAAILVWAILALPRRPWLAGLLLGLAVQAKLISVLFAPAFVVVLWWILLRGRPWSERIRAAVLPAALVAAPLALFELLALVSLGPAGYAQHIRSTGGFLLTGGQDNHATTIAAKIATVFEHWFIPAPLVLVALLLSVIVGAYALRQRLRAAGGPAALIASARGTELAAYAVAAALGLAVFLGWWSTATHTPLWIRHPSPALFASVPILSAFVVVALRALRTWLRVAASAILAALLAAAVTLHVLPAPPAWENLDDQRRTAAELAVLGADHYAAEWGPAVSIVVLSGARVGLWDAGAAVDGIPRLLGVGRGEVCDPPRIAIGLYLVCDPATLP